MIAVGLKLLHSRYQLVKPLTQGNTAQSWLGVDDSDQVHLLKLWTFTTDRPDNLQRALWDAELRTLYRVGSSPGAEDTIMVLRDAGVDLEARAFVMVLQAPGYEVLEHTFARRATTPWLAPRDAHARRALWLGLAELADGIRLLHEQNIVHRDVCAKNIFYNANLGPDSLRLGGFEWSVRLGTPGLKAPPPSWSSPPEFFGPNAFGYRPETDWFGFGMLAARALVNAEPYTANEPVERHRKVLAELNRSTTKLSDLEKAFLTRLIATNPRERITRADEVRAAIQDIAQALQYGHQLEAADNPLVLVINPSSTDLVDKTLQLNFIPDPDRPQDAFNPSDVQHTARLTSFIQSDITNAQLFAVPNASYYVLVGANLILRLVPYESFDRDVLQQKSSWDHAFCAGTATLRWNEGGGACMDLPPGSVVVRTRKQVSNRAIRQNSNNWERFLPAIDRVVQLRASLAKFHEFIRCTNQIELLIRDSELFCFRKVGHAVTEGRETLVIEEAPRIRRRLRFYEIEGGLVEFLLREIESGKRDCKFVVLTGSEEDQLTLPSITKAERWTVTKIAAGDKRLELTRVAVGNDNPRVPKDGTIRTWGMFGQVALIRRRKRAIDRIERHSYLLRSLSAPSQVFMDTGPSPLPVPLSSKLVDEAKQAAIGDVLRVRPIYALQGPPGTGKTTLVAHLLRQIFEDDPVAQVLITAQAHGAVDVLRAKVRNEAFQGVPNDRHPLAIRLGGRPDANGLEEGSAEEVSLQILKHAFECLSTRKSRTGLQEEWLIAVKGMCEALETWTPDSTAPDFCEVVKRGASITYCTTSAGDLEVLAEATQSFDWAIIEEAGKAHGFDLALPLQLGHRWLLIGDHKQLPPYRFEDYRDGIDKLDEVVDALENLPGRAGSLADIEWLRSWRDQTQEERAEFKQYARGWLKTFERAFEYCSLATGQRKVTIDESDGAGAGVLSRQHRMHPTIGDLISTAYYNDGLISRTVDSLGTPLERVRHMFIKPPGIEDKAIVWLDTPWCARAPLYTEVGPDQGKPRYTNPKEADVLKAFISQLKCTPGGTHGQDRRMTLAVLSPYNQQVALINKRLEESEITSAGLSLKDTIKRKDHIGAVDTPARVAYSVDSFQGNQADIIAVSLVRNNNLPVGDGLGFLVEAARMNVLLSRAERLLILVGSWEFFERQISAVPVDDHHLPLWHWKRVMTSLKDGIESGRVLRISATDLLESTPS